MGSAESNVGYLEVNAVFCEEGYISWAEENYVNVVTVFCLIIQKVIGKHVACCSVLYMMPMSKVARRIAAVLPAIHMFHLQVTITMLFTAVHMRVHTCLILPSHIGPPSWLVPGCFRSFCNVSALTV